MLESLDKLPTDDNLNEIAQNDVLDRNKIIVNFIRLLASIEGHYSIALDARWGSGKTFFVKQTERVLRQLFRDKTYYEVEENPLLCSRFENLFKMEEIKSHPMMTLYYDAWQHDNQQDALLSLVFELIKVIPSNDPRLKTELTKSDNVQKSIVPIVQGMLDHFTGIDLKSITRAINDPAGDVLQKIRNQENLISLLTSFFKNLLPDDSTRLVIFIDELDRCRPDYAVQMFERIKHYMQSDQIIFVFSVNIEQLQHTIKHYYGDDFEASSYLDRFFDFHVTLPTPSYEQKRKAASWGISGSIFANWCYFLIEEFKFELREQMHFYEAIEQSIQTHDDSIYSIFSNIEENQKIAFSFLKSIFVPLGLALRIKNITDYYSFIDGRNKKTLDVLYNNLDLFSTEMFYNILDIPKDLNKELTRNKFKENLEKLYDAIFCTIYNHHNKTINVGKFQINGQLQQEVLALLTSLHKKYD